MAMTNNFIKQYKEIESNDIKRVINIASIYGHVSSDYRIYGKSGRNNSEIYTASKAAVIGLTKYYAANYAKFGFRFNSVSPGGIIREQDPEFVDLYSQRCPLERMGFDHEVADLISYLYFCSELFKWRGWPK